MKKERTMSKDTKTVAKTDTTVVDLNNLPTLPTEITWNS
jgi:hypothetical protein